MKLKGVLTIINYITTAVIILLCCLPYAIYSQNIKGKVIDGESKIGVPQATIYLPKWDIGTSTNNNGEFTLSLKNIDSLGKEEVIVRALGYARDTVSVYVDSTNIIALFSQNQAIENVQVIGRKKYSNRNNPAVELIDRVISNKSKNRLNSNLRIQYDLYEKVKLGLISNNKGKVLPKGDFRFFFDNVDTVSKDLSLFTLFLEESNSRVFSQKSPERYKRNIVDVKRTEFDQRYINNPNIQLFLNHVFRQIDIYDESLYMLDKQLLSPIAKAGKVYYRYYITDTIEVDDQQYIQLTFEPRNSSDLLFKGNLSVAVDNNYAVKSANLIIDKEANINFVNKIEISLTYNIHETGKMLLDRINSYVVFGAGKKDAVFGERLSVNENYDLKSPISDTVFQGPEIEEQLSYNKDFHRPVTLNKFEQQTYENVDSLNKMKSFQLLAATGYLLAQGYYNVGKFELGPLEYLYSRNNIEGNRFRIGGRSTQELSEKMFFQGYMAYGTEDDQFKYNLKVAHALNGKSVSKFPAHYLTGNIQKDVFVPGMPLAFLKGDSFFQSFRKNRPKHWMDTRAYELGHFVEFSNHISIFSKISHQQRRGLGDLKFIDSGDDQKTWDDINTTDFEVNVRWAPKEKFYYRNITRVPIEDKHPVFGIQYNKGLNGILNGDYNYDALRFSFSKRFFLQQLGFSKVNLVVGKIWGTLPYPLLEIPTFRDENDDNNVSYDLVNNLEFVADEFVKFSWQHRLEGYLLNKIPLIKKLRWRESFGINAFYGNLTYRNTPEYSNQVIEFQKDEEGDYMTYPMKSKIYYEGFVGIDNIFKIFRVQYLRRFNYLDHKDARKETLRLSLYFKF